MYIASDMKRCAMEHCIVMLAACGGKRSITACVRPSVCLSRRHTHQRAACDAASVHFGPSIRTDILVKARLVDRLRPLLYGIRHQYTLIFQFGRSMVGINSAKSAKRSISQHLV